MAKYTARVEFIVYEFEATNEQEADEIINDLIDKLASVKTDVVWDDVDWRLYEKEGNN
jgi:hypothetical protein